jgi:hypothetical protein
MNVESGAEAALFPEKEYISGFFVAVLTSLCALGEYTVLENFQQELTTLEGKY